MEQRLGTDGASKCTIHKKFRLDFGQGNMLQAGRLPVRDPVKGMIFCQFT
jgi:hypothetical protein